MAINEEALKKQQAISGSLESRSQAVNGTMESRSNNMQNMSTAKPSGSIPQYTGVNYRQDGSPVLSLREQFDVSERVGAGESENDVISNLLSQREGATLIETPQSQKDGLLTNMKENSQAFIDKQNAMLESAYQNQIAQLEQDYMESVRQGEMSVREAQEAFEAQKTSLHENAYLQAEDTRTYGSEMGLGNSQQMVGLQQSDNSRFNKLHGQNVSEKDRRVADIRTRLETIRQQKDSAITNAGLQLELGKAQAQAEGDMMYNDNMMEFSKQDYFANLNQQFDLDKMDIQQGFTQANMDKAFDQDTKLAMQQFNQDLEKIREQSKKKIEEMSAGHDFDIKILDKQLANDLSMESQKFANQMTLNAQSGGGGGGAGGGGSYTTWKKGGQANYAKYQQGASKRTSDFMGNLQAEHDQALRWLQESNDPNSAGYKALEKQFQIQSEREQKAQIANFLAMEKVQDAKARADNTVVVKPTAKKYTPISSVGTASGIGKKTSLKVNPTHTAQVEAMKAQQAKVAAANKILVEATYGKSTNYAPAKQTAAEKKKSIGSGGRQSK